MNVKKWLTLLSAAGKAWGEDNASRLAAALAYYTLFSIAPLLVIAIAIAGMIFGQQAVSGQLFNQISGIVGAQTADMVQEMVKNAGQTESGVIASTLGFATLIWAASNLFSQIQQALNAVWGVANARTSGIVAFAWQRFVAVSMVLGLGGLMVASLVAVTLVSALHQALHNIAPLLVEAIPLTDILVSLLVMTFSCALVFRLLPNTAVVWRDVWGGALLAAILFTFGKYLIGLYLGSASYRSTFGAAGSLVVLLVWVYYSAQIFLFGAEFTKVYARAYGSWRGVGEERMPALTIATATGDPPWPALATAPPTQTPKAPTPFWVLPAALAFLAGLVAASRRR
ncbi:MAG: YihY/virulence factor BrkB family protein [Anaerolineales bacterium]|nr:YihY/virulence factor BrkB family protein [Anaerolineales bacterium]MCB8952426.1 YihY/virulence factor BrkB family protein [Ardenticatenales bacterium]